MPIGRKLARAPDFRHGMMCDVYTRARGPLRAPRFNPATES